MFKRQIEVTVKSMSVRAKDEDGRVATCDFDIEGVDYPLAVEAHPLIGQQLYRLDNGGADWKNTEREYVRSQGIGKLLFDSADVRFDLQLVEFQAKPGIRIAGAVLSSVEIVSVEAVRSGDEFMLTMKTRFKFTVEQASIVAKLLIEQLGQKVWLTFKPMQRNLLEGEEQSVGEYLNERAVKRVGR